MAGRKKLDKTYEVGMRGRALLNEQKVCVEEAVDDECTKSSTPQIVRLKPSSFVVMIG